MASARNGSVPERPVPANTLEYGETLMYGQYSKDLGEFAKKLARHRKSDDDTTGFRGYKTDKCLKCKRGWHWFRDTVIVKIGEDWVFLTLLGVIMALLSFGMDYVIGKCQIARRWMYEELSFSVAAQYFAWIFYTIIFICFSTGFVHIVGPNAIGSGIPEMKTILRGVVLKEYLTFRTLVSKVVGLCTSLGCGLPIGKEGPFVHIASIVASLLGKLITSVKGVYANESRNNEMLAAACAVGVSCTFAAPVGGVLFSIEVTATYFAVRNYWRGFYSAVCGAFIFRLLAVWFKDEETLTAFFKTSLRQEFPFDPLELVAYILIGVVCGFAGALFVFTHRKFVEFMRKQKRVKAFLQQNRFIFPTLIAFVIASLLFPPGLGQFMAGGLTNHDALDELLSNFTWSFGKVSTVDEAVIMEHWQGSLGNIYITLALFIVMRFWMSAIAITMPVPAGVFMPVFTVGAAFGRLVGESMAIWFPNGIGGHHVIPAGYAMVGAAALSGSVTHTISTSVIVFELTGHMAHVLPIVMAVLIANAVATALAPSIYDSLIQIKRLPFLPGIINPQAINAHSVCVETFMVKDVKFISSASTYHEAALLLQQHSFRAFPFVDNQESMILLGSIQRAELSQLIDKQLSDGNKVHFFENVYQVPLKPLSAGEAPQPRFPPAPLERGSSTGSAGSRFSVKKTESGTQSPHVHFDNTVNVNELTMDQELAWENNQLGQVMNFDSCQIDPAPFQLVEKTSLFKVHSLFSLLSLHHAYVTNMGKLVGIVSLKEVRSAIQGYTSPKTPAPITAHQDAHYASPAPDISDTLEESSSV